MWNIPVLHPHAQADHLIKKSQTSDQELLKHEHYRVVMRIVQQMIENGVMEHAAGNCLAVSEMVENLLAENGIAARLVECKLIATTKRNGEVVDFRWVGWDGNNIKRGEDGIDSHLVVVTEGAMPMLIDLTVPHVLPQGRLFVCERLTSVIPGLIGEWTWGDTKIRYDIKKNPRLLGIQQSNLLARMREHQRVEKSIRWLKAGLIIVAVATFLNVVLNLGQIMMRIQTADVLNTIEKNIVIGK